MDKSHDYIIMCKNSKEIQNCWEHQPGDYFVDEDGSVHCWVPGVIGAPEIKKTFGVESEDNLIRLTKYIWLPRYNQLIELAQTVSVAYRDMVFTFYNWVDEPYDKTSEISKKKFTSLEQLWLAFVMQNKFNKYWEKDCWVSA